MQVRPKVPLRAAEVHRGRATASERGSADHVFACWFPLVNGRAYWCPCSRHANQSNARGTEPVTEVRAGADGVRAGADGVAPSAGAGPEAGAALGGRPDSLGMPPCSCRWRTWSLNSRSGKRRVHAVSGVSFEFTGRDPRPGRRIRVREVDHRARPSCRCRADIGSGRSKGPS